MAGFQETWSLKKGTDAERLTNACSHEQKECQRVAHRFRATRA